MFSLFSPPFIVPREHPKVKEILTNLSVFFYPVVYLCKKSIRTINLLKNHKIWSNHRKDFFAK